MIPTSAIAVKPAKELEAGEMGLLMTRGTTYPVIGGITQEDVPVAIIFDDDKVRLEATAKLHDQVMIMKGAQIVVDPQSARKAAPGRELGCPILSGSTLFIEADYQMDFYNVALGPVDETSKGERIAFDQWRIVLHHEGTEYEILNRAKPAE